MSTNRFFHALFAAVVAGVIIAPIFGFQIIRAGATIHLETRWDYIWGGMLAVFTVQLLRPYLLKPLQTRLKPFELPSMAPRLRNVLILLLVLVAMIWPFFAGRAQVDIATLVLIYVMLALGLNIVVGFAGLLDLGFVGFYAVGAYTYALLYHWADWGFWASLPAAGAMAALFGYLLGFPVLRLRGDYLAIVNLGFGEIIRLLLINLYPVTGGPDGIARIPTRNFFGFPMTRSAREEQTTFHELLVWKFNNFDVIVYLYILALILALITLFVSNRLIRMPIGRAWEALREDEIACRSLGLNPTGIKRSEEHTSELQSRGHLVCRLLLEKKHNKKKLGGEIHCRQRNCDSIPYGLGNMTTSVRLCTVLRRVQQDTDHASCHHHALLYTQWR